MPIAPPHQTETTKRSNEVLQFAQDTMVKCTEVISLTIILHDLTISPFLSFAPFMRSLWSFLSPTLQKLTVDITIEKATAVMDLTAFRDFPNLTDLTLNLAYSRFPSRTGTIKDNILPFVMSLSGILESLTISTSMLVDLNPLFDGLPHLPALHKLAVSMTIPSVITRGPTPASSSLAPFIKRHQASLQHLSVRIHHSLTHQLLEDSWMSRGSPGLDFPNLRVFQLGIFSSSFLMDSDLNWHTAIFFLPHLPQLESLTIYGALPFQNVNALFDALSVAGAKPTLRRMTLKVKYMNAELIDLLAHELPLLEELELSFRWYGTEVDHPINHFENLEFVFKPNMKPRRYPDWKLRYLRVLSPPLEYWRCMFEHADTECMMAVARCLTSPPVLGLENADDCLC
ncbi:hypothetical protein C0991_003133 [Blastosporella zonata]|nr:hypothetical protein C0991_003133 [Blastosporella zonata]